MNDLSQTLAQALQLVLEGEFDRNFEREAFFGRRWPRSRYGSSRHHLLVQSGALRRSLRSRTSGGQVEFSSDMAYAAIHNAGGTIRVTERMKRYFWAKCLEAEGSMDTLASGRRRNTARNRRLTGRAEFYRRLALKKVGSTIVIPQRQFVGWNDEVAALSIRHINRYLRDLIAGHPEMALGDLIKNH